MALTPLPAPLVLAAAEPATAAPAGQLITAALIGIALIVVLITWGKVHPFLALMLGSAVLGVVATMPPGDTVNRSASAFGSTPIFAPGWM